MSGAFKAEGYDTVSYIHADHLGGVNVVTNSSGTEIQRKDYQPFGDNDSTGSSGSSGSSDSDHNMGATREEAAGLLRMGNRFLSAFMGFTTPLSDTSLLSNVKNVYGRIVIGTSSGIQSFNDFALRHFNWDQGTSNRIYGDRASYGFASLGVITPFFGL